MMTLKTWKRSNRASPAPRLLQSRPVRGAAIALPAGAVLCSRRGCKHGLWSCAWTWFD